jgi:type II secretory pathway pseudopilin PulG
MPKLAHSSCCLQPRSLGGAGSAQAGFTLVELMVAMTGGLFLSIVVFALSRDTSRFYQQETRVANATLSGVSGFERLSSDLARAGHMVTPNIDGDPQVCNKPDAAWPELVRRLRAITIDDAGLGSASTEVGKAGITPRGIVIAGALNAPEELFTRSVLDDGTGNFTVSLNLRTPSAHRLGLSHLTSATAANLGRLQAIFVPGGTGKIIRLRRAGSEQYAVVSAVSTADGVALLQLAANPALVVRTSESSVQCGIGDMGRQMALSVIDLVRYDVRSMVGDANYGQLFKASGIGGTSGSGLAYEAGRAELVRVELAPDGSEIAATREIVGEYAVDLQFSAWARDATGALAPLDADLLTSTYPSTQSLRAIHVRFSARSREADRELDVLGGSGGPNLYRIPLDTPEGTRFARVRTLQSDIALRNLENSNW